MDNPQNSGELQVKVHNIFVKHPVLPDHKPFSEFREQDSEDLKSFLFTLYQAEDKQTDNEKSVNDVVDLCTIGISDQGLNPDLVRKALGIFLTHSPKAQQIGIVPTTLRINKALRPQHETMVWPVTADTLTGYDTISYFREDHDLNEHHFHWHLVYPYIGIKNPDPKGTPTIVRALDRQGELFLYMHSQMLARYNAELLSWNLDIVHAWSYRDIATFGYTPPPFHAHTCQSGDNVKDCKTYTYTPRPAHRGWHDNDCDKQEPSIAKMDKWRNNILKAIETEKIGTVRIDYSYGEFNFTEKDAMNWIGMITEALDSNLVEVKPGTGEVVNRDLYGSLHNNGHDKFSSISTNGNGVMGANHDAVRDPVFWMWHRHIDDFRLAVIKKYEHNIDDCKPEAKLTCLKILPQDPKSKTPEKGITTILGHPQLKLDEVNAKIDHEPYKWEIEVESTQATAPTMAEPQTFTVRLFIVPKDFIRDERSWIEMDKFTYNLTDKTATITRLDTESSVARKTFKKGESASPQCQCGWPQNMMLPAGKPDGMDFLALAMLTKDELGDGGTKALSFCGAKDRIYPDCRGMGFPFDKKWSTKSFGTPDAICIESCDEANIAASEKTPHMMVSNFAIYRTTKKTAAV